MSEHCGFIQDNTQRPSTYARRAVHTHNTHTAQDCTQHTTRASRVAGHTRASTRERGRREQSHECTHTIHTHTQTHARAYERTHANARTAKTRVDAQQRAQSANFPVQCHARACSYCTCPASVRRVEPQLASHASHAPRAQNAQRHAQNDAKSDQHCSRGD